MSDKHFTPEEEEIIKLLKEENADSGKITHYNANRLDILFGIMFVLTLNIAGQSENLTVLNKAGVLLSIVAITVFIVQLIYLIHTSNEAGLVWQNEVRRLIIGKRKFDAIKKSLNDTVEDQTSTMKSASVYTIVTSIQGVLFIAALVLVLL